MQRFIAKLFAASLAAPLLFAVSTASAAADRASCGNINLLAAGECHLEVSGGCTAKCEPINFTAACEGQCNVTIDASCTASCGATCNADCTANPAMFDCQARCETDCGGSCMANCSAAANMSDCAGYCQGRCTNDCKAQCNVVPPSASCDAQCKGCCSGSCQAKADFNCNYDCSTKLTGGCQTDCQAPNGALFCDGQYVHVSNLDDCVAYLESQFNLTIDYQASGHCDATGCEGEASAGVSCSAAPIGSASRDVGAIAALVVGAGFVASRRRRRA